MKNIFKICLLTVIVVSSQGCSMTEEKEEILTVEQIKSDKNSKSTIDKDNHYSQQEGGRSRPGIYSGAGQEDALNW